MSLPILRSSADWDIYEAMITQCTKECMIYGYLQANKARKELPKAPEELTMVIYKSQHRIRNWDEDT